MPLILSWDATRLNPETVLASLGFVGRFLFSHSSRFGLGERLQVFSDRTEKGRSQKPSWYSISSTSSALSLIASLAADEESTYAAAASSEQRMNNVVLNQAALMHERLRPKANREVKKPDIVLPGNLSLLRDAYDRCCEVCAEFAKNFHLGKLLMTPERQRAMRSAVGGFDFSWPHFFKCSSERLPQLYRFCWLGFFQSGCFSLWGVFYLVNSW